MPKLKYTKSSVGAIIKKAEEGIVLTKKEQEAYQFMVITGEQIRTMTKRINEAILAYAEFSQSLTGIVKEVVDLQKGIAEQVRSVLDAFSKFSQINILVQIPRLTITTMDYFPQPVRIFVQPNDPYRPEKILSPPQRKYNLPLSSVQIEGKGFTLEGEYIKGMTRKSEVGQLFELMLRTDLKGKIPDKLINEIKSSDSDELAYRARSYVIRDLKEILAGNKLILDMNRYRGIQQYHVKGIIKLIRKPKKVKKLVVKGKTN